MVGVLQHPHDQPDDFALFGAVLGWVANDPVRVGRWVEEADRGIDMVEVADDLLLFGADTLEERGQFAALLNEACQFDSEMRAGLEMWNGAWSEALYNRCLAYAAADDLYWGLRALLFDRLSPRTSLEFRKYAAWRLLRCRMRINRPGFEETLRRLG